MTYHALVHLLLSLPHPLAVILLQIARMWIPGFVLLCCGLVASGGQSITLGWDANTGSTVAGYVVCYGVVNQKYFIRSDVGTNLTVVITDLQPGQTYFFAVANYDSDRVESAFSSRIYYLVPGVLRIGEQTNVPGGLKIISFPIAPMHWYELQSSTNLQDWGTIFRTAVCTTNIWAQYTDSQSAMMPRRFYRLVMH